MTSVALQLFQESLTLATPDHDHDHDDDHHHNRHQPNGADNRALCFTSAFVGMGILGVSFALTAD